MEISYINTYNHSLQFNLYHLVHNRTQQLALFFAMGLCAFIYWFQLEIPDNGLLINWLTFIGYEIGTIMFYTAISILFLLFTISRLSNIAFFTNHQITLTDDKLVEQTPFNKSEVSWSGIHNVVQNRSFIFIYTSEHASHVIPKKAFRSPDKAKEFFDYAYKCWQSKKIV